MKVNEIKIGMEVYVQLGKDIDTPFYGQVVGFIQAWVVVDCDGDHLEVSPNQVLRVEDSPGYRMEQDAKSDTHSCAIRSQYTDNGQCGPGSYCTECGALVESEDARQHELDHYEI